MSRLERVWDAVGAPAFGAARWRPLSRLAGDAAGRKNMLLLVQLRWIAVVGQITTIAAVQLALGIPLPLAAMSLVLGALVALNVVSLVRLRADRAVTNRELFIALVFDVAALTVQLYLSGGATNPFISLYLLQVTLSAVLLEAWSTWVMAALTGAGFLGLSVAYVPLRLVGRLQGELFPLHIAGMVVGFVLDAALLVTFVGRISQNLRARDARLADLRQQAAEEDHIVRMGLLASGAAHELGTPLATVSVILNDWRRTPAIAKNPDMAQELADMEEEIRRCKAIVTGILLSAGEARGEAPEVTTVHAFLDEVMDDWRAGRAVKTVDYRNRFGPDLPIVSDAALKKVIFNVLDNAAEASPDWVRLEAARRDGSLVLAVCDAGPGFAPAMLEALGRPYNSSKNRQGGGLGLFLVVNVARKLGGAVTARNRATGGAEVVLTLPLSALEISQPPSPPPVQAAHGV